MTPEMMKAIETRPVELFWLDMMNQYGVAITAAERTALLQSLANQQATIEGLQKENERLTLALDAAVDTEANRIAEALLGFPELDLRADDGDGCDSADVADGLRGSIGGALSRAREAGEATRTAEVEGLKHAVDDAVAANVGAFQKQESAEAALATLKENIRQILDLPHAHVATVKMDLSKLLLAAPETPTPPPTFREHTFNSDDYYEGRVCTHCGVRWKLRLSVPCDVTKPDFAWRNEQASGRTEVRRHTFDEFGDCTRCGKRIIEADAPCQPEATPEPPTPPDTFPICEHGTAMDVHCCNCHGGFLFDSESCVCKFDSVLPTSPAETPRPGETPTYPRTIHEWDGLRLTQSQPPNSYLIVTRIADGKKIVSTPCVVTEDKDEIIRGLFAAWLKLVAAPSSSPAPGTCETAWLIEAYKFSVLHYWTGDVGIWSEDVSQAIQFARHRDAEAMLTWHLKGAGRVVEHMWPEPKPLHTPAAPQTPAPQEK